jgi:putative ABC transport system permease protein
VSLFTLLSYPYIRRHGLRTGLTVAAIALGVALLVGMRTANESVLFGFSRTVDAVAGKTELQVTAGDAGFPEDVLERVQGAKSVAVAVPVIEAIADTRLAGQGSLYVLGVDMTGDRSLRDYDMDSGEEAVIDDALVFLAQPDSIMLSAAFAAKNGIASGETITLGTALGDRTFVVRGIMQASGLASAFGGNLAVMDIYAAQKMFGRGFTFDRIDLALAPGATIADAQRELTALLGPAFEVTPPSTRGQQFEAMLAGYGLMMTLSSAFALFIGMFIIYNSFLVAVHERRAEIGILRALGATTGQIRRIFLGESAIFGLAGSLIGLGAGLLAARAIAGFLGTLIADVYGVAQRAGEVAADPVLLGAAVFVGVATSVAAAAVPATHAARVDPVEALARGRFQAIAPREGRLRGLAAAALAVAALACVAGSESRPLFYAGYLLMLVAALLVTPMAALVLTKVLRPALQWLRPVEGALAADSLLNAPRRTAASVTALMLSVALVVAFEGMARASFGSIEDWMHTALNPDLFVLPSPSLDVQTVRFPGSMEPDLAAVPGVARLQAMRNARVAFRDTRVMLVAIDTASLAETEPRPPIAGDRDTMYGRAAAGEGVMVSDSLATLQALSLGDTVEIPSPDGTLRLPIVGVVLDYSDQQGAIIMDRALFIRHWRDDSVNAFRVYLEPGVSVADARERILARFAGAQQVFVLTNGELKAYVSRVAGQWFGLTTVQVALAVLVAILGIVNTLTVSITDRRRELGVLRAVGARHGQVRRTIWMEALGVAAVALALGCALGAVNLYYILEIVHRDVAGMRLSYEFPIGTVATLVPVILGAAFLAALWPSQLAVRGSLREALEYE